MDGNATLVGYIVLGLILLIPGLAALGGVFIWVGKISTKADSANDRSHKLANELTKFQIEVARDYATKDLLSEIRAEITTAIGGLATRIDTFLHPK